jgi:hypothetical protein
VAAVRARWFSGHMKTNSLTTDQDRRLTTDFDLCRLSKSKESVDVCPNTIRAYGREGLRLYRAGKAVFFSKRELESFIRNRALGSQQPQAA